MDISFYVPLSPGREVVMQEYAHEPLPPCSCSQNGGKLCWHQVVGCLKQSTEFQFHLNRTLSTVTATEHLDLALTEGSCNVLALLMLHLVERTLSTLDSGHPKFPQTVQIVQIVTGAFN